MDSVTVTFGRHDPFQLLPCLFVPSPQSLQEIVQPFRRFRFCRFFARIGQVNADIIGREVLQYEQSQLSD